MSGADPTTYDPFILLNTRICIAAADMLEQIGVLTGIRRCRVPHAHEPHEMDDLRAAVAKAQGALAAYDACVAQELDAVTPEQFAGMSRLLGGERPMTIPDATASDFDATREPMRALRDLVVLCECTVFDPGEEAILTRARDGFAHLRALFGDTRPSEDIAEGAMIEPSAPLISAAPDMFAALTKTRTNLAGLSASDDDIFAAMIRRVDAAIAKATR